MNKKYKLLIYMASIILLVEISIAYGLPFLENNELDVKKVDIIPNLSEGYNRIILGDSRSHQGIDPRILDRDSGFLTYNMAIPGMQTPFYYYICNRWIQERGVPKQVVCNISFYLLGGRQWMKDIYFSYYTPSITEAYDAFENNLTKTPAEWYLRTRIPSFRYNKRIRSLLDYDCKKIEEVIEHVHMRNHRNYHGYLSRGETHIEDNIDLKNTEKWTIKLHKGYSVYQKYLRRFFALSDEYGFDIYIYEFPWPIQYKESEVFNRVHDYYTELICSIANDYPRVHIITNNYYYEHSMFVDPLHVNDFGARKLSEELAEYLN